MKVATKRLLEEQIAAVVVTGRGEKNDTMWHVPHMQLNEFHVAIFAWPCVLSDRPHVLWWLSPAEWDRMQLHDAVGKNCKKGATTENQGADVKYMC